MKRILKLISRFTILYFIVFSLLVVFAVKQEIPVPVTTNVPVIGQIQPTPSQTASKSVIPTPTTAPIPQDAFSQIKNHNSQKDCWIGYEGHAYNITSYFGQHPGGDAALLKYCGRDATSAFDSKDKSPAVPHSGAAKSLLQQFLVQ